jgi:hypothetical protein
MDGWIELDPEWLDRRRELNTTTDGVEVLVFVSPYDVPDAVRAHRDTPADYFVIEFRYIQEEPWSRHPCNRMVALRTGSHSGRLLGLEIDLRRARNNSVVTGQDALRVAVAAIDSQLLSHRHNFSLATQILKLKASDLIALYEGRPRQQERPSAPVSSPPRRPPPPTASVDGAPASKVSPTPESPGAVRARSTVAAVPRPKA